ncbi:hypothetical protein [Paenibacillus sp. NEAU-GSW1]|uniref:hypothetical protein n=1 Tax=Paenibacillus sp. NEAU-GSW1 TaxID=2682486 RepID=UPI0012E1635B|nr:hypothetical protein [Paenibacillus sp. NEAU-GSW1]MUT65967.1 hypothetical protein [Paenibacillus sp. NEAU-GSW1]
MVDGWVTMLMLAFGIIVAVIGVTAYLRMFNKEKSLSSSHSSIDIPPPLSRHTAPEEDRSSDERQGR